MNIRETLLITATIMVLGAGPAFAAANNNVKNSNNGNKSNNKAPEIDAASGTSAIALLSGVLLLAGERVRSKRSSKV